MSEPLSALVRMSRTLGDPAWRLAILGEGNTSRSLAGGEFLVKASGTCLRDISEAGFVRCRAEPILGALDGPPLDDAGIEDVLRESRTEPSDPMPSVETFLHAYLLSLDGIRFVGHTHPIAVTALLCTEGADPDARLFPDHVVCCGPYSAIVPYTDPGLPLARALRDAVKSYIDTHGTAPRSILMENHGLIAIGSKPEEVVSCTLMAEKAAEIHLRALAAGRPRALTPRDVLRIHGRSDEEYRRARIGRMSEPMNRPEEER